MLSSSLLVWGFFNPGNKVYWNSFLLHLIKSFFYLWVLCSYCKKSASVTSRREISIQIWLLLVLILAGVRHFNGRVYSGFGGSLKRYKWVGSHVALSFERHSDFFLLQKFRCNKVKVNFSLDFIWPFITWACFQSCSIRFWFGVIPLCSEEVGPSTGLLGLFWSRHRVSQKSEQFVVNPDLGVYSLSTNFPAGLPQSFPINSGDHQKSRLSPTYRSLQNYRDFQSKEISCSY